MKEAVGSLGLTQIVIFFLVLFTGYICISVNTNKAYNVKTEVVDIIQQHNGFDENTLAEIQEYMTKVGYRTTGRCGDEWTPFGASSMSPVADNGKAILCIKQVYEDSISTYNNNGTVKPLFYPNVYYEVKVFFGLDLPLINLSNTLSTQGMTRKLYTPVPSIMG